MALTKVTTNKEFEAVRAVARDRNLVLVGVGAKYPVRFRLKTRAGRPLKRGDFDSLEDVLAYLAPKETIDIKTRKPGDRVFDTFTKTECTILGAGFYCECRRGRTENAPDWPQQPYWCLKHPDLKATPESGHDLPTDHCGVFLYRVDVMGHPPGSDRKELGDLRCTFEVEDPH